jgi:hypothetical protein
MLLFADGSNFVSFGEKVKQYWPGCLDRVTALSLTGLEPSHACQTLDTALEVQLALWAPDSCLHVRTSVTVAVSMTWLSRLHHH